MMQEQIRAAIAARPDTETLQEAAAAAAYVAVLDAQDRNLPSSVRAGILVDYAAAWRDMRDELEAIAR